MTQRPNILLIVMDATRFDYLSAYGYPRENTPNLDRLAEDGILFERAFATAPWTPPSHASLFTGNYPSRHGVDVNENLYLSEENRTLAEILSENGYRTFGVLPDAHLSSARGFHKGFQKYIELWRIPYLYPEYDWMDCLLRNLLFGRDKRTYYTNRVIQRWLRANWRGTDPFFIFLNYKTAHNSYQPPRAFKRRFQSRSGPGIDMRKVKFYSREGGYPYMARRFEMTDEEFSILKSWYVGAIAYMDFRLGELIQTLKEAGAYENTLIIVTADHGENFGEHHLGYHMFCLYESLIHVPLIMSWPAGLPRGRRVPGLVSLTDVVPTLVELLQLEEEGSDTQGTSLIPFDGREYHDHVFAEFGRPHYMLKRLQSRFPGDDFSRFDKGLRCIRTEQFKLIVGSDGTEEFYDLATDPGEICNLSGKQPKVAVELRDTLANWGCSMENFTATGKEPDENESVRRSLQKLGYF
ncbi:MAG: sulfatase family protein [Candidatus Binatia bacterium]